jgi:hypothetical protein
MQQEIDWNTMRLELAAQGKTPAQIEAILDRWYRACISAGLTNDNKPQERSKPK